METGKRSAGDGFRKFDHVEIIKPDGKWKGIINCFDKTPKGKPRRLRVEYFDPEVSDSRKSGNTTQLRLLQKRDGYGYSSRLSNPEMTGRSVRRGFLLGVFDRAFLRISADFFRVFPARYTYIFSIAFFFKGIVIER